MRQAQTMITNVISAKIFNYFIIKKPVLLIKKLPVNLGVKLFAIKNSETTCRKNYSRSYTNRGSTLNERPPDLDSLIDTWTEKM